MRYYDHFIIPFLIGVGILFCVTGYKYIRWYTRLSHEQKKLIHRRFFTRDTIDATGEVISEALLHRRIFRINPLLGYMHMSLAFGWFLLIVVGWIEASIHLSGDFIPLHAHVFYKFFATKAVETPSGLIFANVMDALLLFVLSGVAIAWFKRLRSRAVGLKRTTNHIQSDKIALMALWLIFPIRLIAESASSGVKGMSSFLTGNLGEWIITTFGPNFTGNFSLLAWWGYSLALCVFFISFPFSRYMHIFTEIPLIYLRRYGLRSSEQRSSFDHFQLETCSRCGICLDPCPLPVGPGRKKSQSVYFIRDRRYHNLSETTAANCMMCGRCEARCPVGLELNTLRLNSRVRYNNVPVGKRYAYLGGLDTSTGNGKVGYFAGCMTHLTPNTIRSMRRIFQAAGEEVWYADADGGICCGRPMKLSGEIDAARELMSRNRELFLASGIETLVTSCPICLKVFREDYELQGVRVLHHSQYISELTDLGRIHLANPGHTITYHDPCELGRGCGIYEEPRKVIRRIGKLFEPEEYGRESVCCGSSLANLYLNDKDQRALGRDLAEKLTGTGAQVIVTSCPQCKKAIGRHVSNVVDLAEITAAALM